jgi:hypothetical protein
MQTLFIELWAGTGISAMKSDTVNIPKWADKCGKTVAIIAVVLSGIILVMHLLTHTVFFDETIHVRYLWSLSSGLRPNIDFFCLYPTLGYVLTMPFMSVMPKTPDIVLALRCIPIAIALLIGIVYYRHGRRTSNEWCLGIAAFLLVVTSPGISAFFTEYSIDHIAALVSCVALLIFFSPPCFQGAAAASALCLASVLIMPKYVFPLFFGMLGYLAAWYIDKRNLAVLTATVIASSAATVLVVILLLNQVGDSLASNFRYAYLLNYRYNAAIHEHLGTGPFFTRTVFYVSDYYRDNILLAVVTILGITGWVFKVWRERDPRLLAGCGVLCGTLASTAVITVFCEQYIAPVVLCLAMFAPFMTFLPLLQANARSLRLLLVCAVLVVLIFRLASVAGEFKLTPFNSRGVTSTVQRKLEKIDMVLPVSHALEDYANLLEIIPKNGRVVAAWPYHPLLRRDLTFHAYDDRPSLSHAFETADPLLKTFSPGYFKATLEAAPPAMITIQGLDNYYPPGWGQVAEAFLEQNKALYALYPLKMFDAYIRKDLLGKIND